MIIRTIDVIEAGYLFDSAANAWIAGSNSGDATIFALAELQCEELRDKGTKILAPYGITVSFPGLYPIYHVDDQDFHSLWMLPNAYLIHT